jgi:DNA-binding GntR family transcriptional regulator
MYGVYWIHGWCGSVLTTFVPAHFAKEISPVNPDIDASTPGEATNGTSIRSVYRSMQDIVFETLRDEILSGKLQPGYSLNTLALSSRLGVSRTPIREALNRLVSIGLVENIPHRGCFVRKLSVEQVVEVYYIRAALAGVCARLATKRITEAQKRKLIELCEKMEKDKPGEDLKAMLKQNFEFHNIIFKAAHSPSIESLALQYYHQSEQFRALSLELPGRFEEACREHRRILQAIVDGDADCAEQSSREHQLNTARRITKSLGYEGEI